MQMHGYLNLLFFMIIYIYIIFRYCRMERDLKQKRQLLEGQRQKMTKMQIEVSINQERLVYITYHNLLQIVHISIEFIHLHSMHTAAKYRGRGTGIE